jgi:intein-encoded DNA endonuclease-like protein
MKNMTNDLIENINKIHSTELGLIRVKKNLELKTNDIIKYCKNNTKEADKINRKGKNWYVYKGDCIITINANSYTIITAHRIKKQK